MTLRPKPLLKLVEVIARPFFFRTWNWKPGDDVVINASVPTEESPEALPQPCWSTKVLRFGYLAVHADRFMTNMARMVRNESALRPHWQSLADTDETLAPDTSASLPSFLTASHKVCIHGWRKERPFPILLLSVAIIS